MEEFKGKDVLSFTKTQFGSIRITMEDGEPWFVAADVCRALDIGDTSKACSRLDDDEKGASSIRTLGGLQRLSVVNESGLYTLILGSRKKEAKGFKRWITHEVLPTLRHSGVYVDPSIRNQINVDEFIDITSAAYNTDATPFTRAIASSLQESTAREDEYQDEIVTKNDQQIDGLTQDEFVNLMMSFPIPPARLLKAAIFYMHGFDVALRSVSSPAVSSMYARFYARIFHQRGIALIPRQIEASRQNQRIAKMNLIMSDEWPGVFAELWGFGLLHNVNWNEYILALRKTGLLPDQKTEMIS